MCVFVPLVFEVRSKLGEGRQKARTVSFRRTLSMNNNNFDNNNLDNNFDDNFGSGANSDLLELDGCDDVIARLGDYVDNDLSQNARLVMDTHLNDCPECAALFASYTHVIEGAAELREPEQPIAVDVQNRLRRALNQRLGLSLSYIA